MSARRYRVLLPLVVHTKKGSYKQHEEFENDFTADEERENVESGLLAIVPSTYRVLTDSRVNDHGQGETFAEAYLIEREAVLIQGGHIERVETKKKENK